MRLGLVLEGSSIDAGGAGLVRAARAAEDRGLDLVWLRQDRILTDPFVAATSVAAATTGLRVGVEVEVGTTHPVALAESAVVCDLVLRGRLVLGLRAAEGISAEDFAEALAIIVRSHRPGPFQSPGGRWPTPANLEANTFTQDTTVRVTPAPAQLELPTWIVGNTTAAADFGLSPIVVGDAAGREAWTSIEAAIGKGSLRMSRPGIVPFVMDGERVDHHAMIDSLLAGRHAWGLDTALFELPAARDEAARDRVVNSLGQVVRPRVQQDRLPPGLVSWWDEELLSP